MPLVPWIAVLRSGAPIVATFHVHREEGHRWYPRYRRLLDPLMARVRRRLAVSDAARRTVADAFPGRYEILPNGIDVERFATPVPRPPQMPVGRLHTVYVGRLEPRKGVDRLLRAMVRVQQEHAAARLVIVGEGPDRSALESLARQLGVDALFAGRVSDAQLPSYLQAADVVSSPALSGESFGIVLLEALASGRPVVATRIPGYAELAADTDSVRLVTPDDVDALAKEIGSLLGDAAQRAAMGARGPAVASRFAWGRVAERLEAIYAEVVADQADQTATSGRNEYGRSGLKASDASDRFERPFTR